MHNLYILKSTNYPRYYVGIASDVDKRLKRHNAGEVRSTKAYKPYTIIHTEGFPTLSRARSKERQLKRAGHVERYLNSNMALSSNG